MIYIQCDFKPGYIVKDEDIKNFKYSINRYPLIKINNKIEPLIIQELFLNYKIVHKMKDTGRKHLLIKETIINIYKNRENIDLINYI